MVEWIAIIAAVILASIPMIKSFGYDSRRMDEFSRHHKDHYNHAGDQDIHWTKREREELTRTLDEIRSDVKELLKR